jgi:hypothetical protein
LVRTPVSLRTRVSVKMATIIVKTISQRVRQILVFEHKKDAMIFNKNVVHGKGKVVKVKVTKTEEK